MKKIIKVLLLFLLFISLSGCSKNKGLLDFPQYKDIDISSIREINVEWDISENAPIVFSITEKTEIDYILDKLCNKETFIEDDESWDGGHSVLILVGDNNITRVSLFCIKDNNKTYCYSTSDVYDYVHSIGIKLEVIQ